MTQQQGFSLADGGIETDLIGRLGQDLPEEASFVLLDTVEGRNALADYFRGYLDVAAEFGTPLVLDTPTWRASRDWGALLGVSAADLDETNQDAVAFVRALALEHAPGVPLTVAGVIGPRVDDYVAWERMTAAEARRYHAPQALSLAAAGADHLVGTTMFDVAEATGVALAARDARIPVVVSFSVNAAGLLEDGASIAQAIAAVDAATEAGPLCYQLNCAHPDEVRRGLGGEAVLHRIGALRLNAARADAEEDAADTPEEFSRRVLDLTAQLPEVRIIGGCCGTDSRHARSTAARFAAVERSRAGTPRS
ncbi:homocysteine S-methyltransferase family protein [Leucobacter sp. M11]|uniref:homocysteine S-methyltransferase family protein n=1 Tax=Leucobacter sp. M11 TaxID=2993565 RepID=UPI002D7F871F|nr:homocysteine S-methyltransferase family protein [Leucobacter sp. M11]MEB4613857.1 homocysteine S-methyltransferase family protein [Leucobacter sp. M11]